MSHWCPSGLSDLKDRPWVCGRLSLQDAFAESFAVGRHEDSGPECGEGCVRNQPRPSCFVVVFPGALWNLIPLPMDQGVR